MELMTIFGEKTNAVYAIRYPGQDKDELDRLLLLWRDYEFVKAYLQERIDLLEDAFGEGITLEEAITEIIDEVMMLRCALVKHFVDGTLQQLFMPLRNDDVRLYIFQRSKTKYKSRRLWRPKIRIYAIRLDTNCYVITGGGIKLTKAMQDCPALRTEITKLDRTELFLKNHDIRELF